LPEVKWRKDCEDGAVVAVAGGSRFLATIPELYFPEDRSAGVYRASVAQPSLRGASFFHPLDRSDHPPPFSGTRRAIPDRNKQSRIRDVRYYLLRAKESSLSQMARPTRRLDSPRGYALMGAVTSSEEGGIQVPHGGEKKCLAIKYELSVLSLLQVKFHGLLRVYRALMVLEIFLDRDYI